MLDMETKGTLFKYENDNIHQRFLHDSSFKTRLNLNTNNIYVFFLYNAKYYIYFRLHIW